MGKIIENYQLKQQLGEGVYAKVYKAVHLVTKQEVAIKVVQAQKFKQIPKLEQCTVNQINILSGLQSCPYIVKYIDMLKTANNFYFVYQYCNGGTLDKLMQKEGVFPQKKALLYFRQIMEAFKILSKNNIMHRDIKPDNILLHNGAIKIADFGFCKPLQNANQLAQTMLGSPIYMAPEVLKGEVYTSKADIWSIGVVLFQMVFGKCPFQSKSIAKLIKMLQDEDVIIPQYPKISQTLKDLLKKILVKDFSNRIDWKQMFQYNITESGDLFPPGIQPTTQQFGLRQSIRNSGNFPSSGLTFANSSNNQQPPLYQTQQYQFSQNNSGVSTNGSMNGSMNDSIKNSPLLSPKMSKQQDMRYKDLMKKKSPLKMDQPINNPNTSINYNNKNDKFPFNDRNNRLQLLLKNHGKCSVLNQMVLDLYKLQQPKGLYIGYFIFKGIQKQINSLFQSLKKQTSADNQDPFRQFKLSIDKQIDSVKANLFLIRDCLQQDGEYKVSQLQSRRQQIIKSYLESVKLTKQQQLILILQIVDYLEDAVLIKKDAYQKLTKEHLQKQLKYKFGKYNIDKDFS